MKMAVLITALLGLSLCVPAKPAVAAFASLEPETLLENEHTRVQKFTLPPGQSSGAYTHRHNELLVVLRGGILEDASGRRTRWDEGRVGWHAASTGTDAALRNGGGAPIEFLAVEVKSGPARHGSPAPHLNYPNIPGEDLLENDWLVVQRFRVPPGHWEGVHAHHPHMLWIHIHGGQWAARSATEAEHPYPRRSADGSVGWMAPVPLEVGHESRNIDTAPIDLIWVSFRQ